MKILKYISTGLVIIIGILLISTLLLQHCHLLINLHTTLQQHFTLDIYRYIVIVMLMIGWSYWIKIIGRLRHWETDFTERLIGIRWWAFVFFASMEILFWWSNHS